MEFIRRDIQKTQRNGEIKITATDFTNYGGTSVSGGSGGNYLPAISNGDGTYLVDLTKVQFSGSIVAYGEVTAYGSGESGGSTTTGNVTIYDGLDSEAVDVALSANQGRILKELIGNGGVETLEKLQDTELTDLQDGQILVYNAEKGLWLNSTANIKADDYLLKSVWDSVFTVNDNGDLRVKTNLIGDKEISAYGAGSSYGSGSITIVDSLLSTATDAALSANQGRVLKELIDSISVGDFDLSGYYSKEETDNLLKSYATTSSLTNHTGDTTKHITSTERTNWNTAYESYHTHTNKSVLDGITTTLISNWNTAYTNNHTHSNKSVLDGITSTKVSNWDGVVTNWNKAFTFDSSGDLKVKVNVIGEKEISAWGAGTSSGTGAITIVDGLTSTATNAALSANQGRILKELIESYSGGDVDLSNYYTKTQVDDLIDDVDPSWSNISGKPTFATVATSGSYSDLSNKPSLATVATSGKYSDLTGKPTIPDVSKYLPLSGGTMTGSIITPADDDLGIIPATNNYGQIGSSSKKFYRMYASTFYGDLEGNVSWSNITNKPTSMPASDVYSWAKASSKPSYSWSEITSKPTIPTNNNQLTNGAGYITSSGSITGNAATATKLATSRTLWGQSFNGTANVSGNMTGVGSISCTSVSASGEVTAHSDKRLKSNIKPLEVRGELNPVTYVKDGKESIGFIADEVKEVYPELVITDESTDEKYLSLNYAQLTAVLYAEIKELKNQIKELNEKVRTMAN